MNGGNKGTIGGSIVALVSAAVGLAVAFGVDVSKVQEASIIAFVTAAITVAPIVGALLDHSHRQATARQEAAATIAVAAVSGAVVPSSSSAATAAGTPTEPAGAGP